MKLLTVVRQWYVKVTTRRHVTDEIKSRSNFHGYLEEFRFTGSNTLLEKEASDIYNGPSIILNHICNRSGLVTYSTRRRNSSFVCEAWSEASIHLRLITLTTCCRIDQRIRMQMNALSASFFRYTNTCKMFTRLLTKRLVMRLVEVCIRDHMTLKLNHHRD